MEPKLGLIGQISAWKFSDPGRLKDMLECYGASEQAVRMMQEGKSRLAFIFSQRNFLGINYIIAIADSQMASKFKSFVDDIHDLGAAKRGVSEMDVNEVESNKKIVIWVEKCNMATEDTRPLR